MTKDKICTGICYQQWVDMFNKKDKECFGLQLQVGKLRQALDDIEKVTKGYCKNMCAAETKETCEDCMNNEVLNIINKTKEPK